MVQDTGLGQEMFVSAYKDQDGKIMCYRYTEDPVDVNVRVPLSGFRSFFFSVTVFLLEYPSLTLIVFPVTTLVNVLLFIVYHLLERLNG